jgi:PKD domain
LPEKQYLLFLVTIIKKLYTTFVSQLSSMKRVYKVMSAFLNSNISIPTVKKSNLNVVFSLLTSCAVIISGSSRAQDCTVNAGLPQTICPGDPLTLTGVFAGNLAAAPNPMWTIVSGNGGTITNPSSAITTVTGYLASPTVNTTIVYKLSVTCLDGVRTSQDVTVTVKRQPSKSTVGNDTSVCSTGTYGPLQGSALSNAETGHWTAYPAGGVTFSNSASPTSNYTVSQPGLYTLTWTVTTAGVGQQCFTNASMTVTEAGPAGVSAGSNQTLSCSGTSTTLHGSNPGLPPQIGIWSLVSGPNTPSFGNVNAATTSLSNLIPGTYVLQWAVSGPCASGTATVTINVANVNNTDGVGSLPDLTYCIGSGITSALLTGTTPDPGATVTWAPNGSPATGTTIDSANNPTTKVSGLNSAAAAVYSYNYTITTSGGCTSTGTQKIEFVDAVSLIAPANQHILLPCGQTATTFTINRGTPSNLTGSNVRTTAVANFGHGGAVFLGSSGNVDTWSVSTCTPDTINSIRFTYSTPCSSAYVDVTFETSSGTNGANAGTDQMLPCAATSTNLAGNQVNAPQYGTWYQVDGPNTAVLADSSLYNTFLSGLTYGDYDFRWVISNGSTCMGNQDTVNIAVPASVSAISAGPDTTICYGMPYRLVSSGLGAGQAVKWTVTPSAGITFSPNANVENPIIDGTAASTVYTFVKMVYSTCDTAVDTVIISTSAVQGPIASNAGIDQCLGAAATTITLNGNDATPATGTWTAVGSIPGTITSPNASNSTVTGMTPGTYQFAWTITTLGCGYTTDTVAVTIAAPATTANAGADQHLCGATSTTMAANTAVVGFGKWNQIGGAPGVTIADVNDATTTISGLKTGSYFFTWTISNGACASNSDTVVITVASAPDSVASAGSNQDICGTSTVLHGSALGTSAQHGEWDVMSAPPGSPAPSFSSFTNPNATVSGLVTGSYVLQWAISKNGGCAASVAQVTLNVIAPASISMPTDYCDIRSMNLIGSTNTNGTWSVVSQPAGSPTVSFSSVVPGQSYLSVASPIDTGSYTFRYDLGDSNSCASNYATKTVNVYYPVSPTSAGTDMNICLGTTVINLSASSPAVGVGHWYLSSGPNTPAFSDATSPTCNVTSFVPGIYHFRWTVTNGTCPASNDSIQVNVERAANAGPNQMLCGTTTTVVSGNMPVIGQGTWSYISGPSGSVITVPNSPMTDINNLSSGSDSSTYVYQWNTTLAGCAPNVSNITITDYALPTTANAGPDQMHVGPSTRLSANNPVIGTGMWSVYAGPNVPVFSHIDQASTSISGLVSGTYVLEWTITNGGCSSSSFVTIVSDRPQADTINNPTICYSAGSGAVNVLGLSGSDANNGGTIFSYTMSTIPDAAAGILYYFDGSSYHACVPGLVLTPTEANHLQFAPATGFTGTASCLYTATNNFGYVSDVAPYNITVASAPSASFTVDSLSENLSGNLFAFTFTGTTGAGYNYSWSFGDGTTSTVLNPAHSYAAAGLYVVTVSDSSVSGACASTYSLDVAVLSNSVSTGNGGGLESESLGGIVSLRDFTKFKNSANTHFDYANAPLLNAVSSYTERTTAGGRSLSDFVPTNLNATTTPYITTPADIATITTAVDVFSVDYVAGNQAKAVVLAITTLKKAYNHTKSICDRFKGATLLNTKKVVIQGFNFIQFALQQPDGTIEYCIAFDAGKSAGSNTFNLQSKWLITEYKGDDSVFNFQAWAADPSNTVTLVNKILTNLSAVMPLQQIDSNFQLPAAFIASGKRNKGNLNISVTNTVPGNGSFINGTLAFQEMKNEFANPDSLISAMQLAYGTGNNVNLQINDGYQYQGGLLLNGVLVDEVYMADGNWSLDYDHSLTHIAINQPTNEINRVYVDGEYPVYRGLAVKATSADYISAYKFIAPGDEAVDLTKYQSLKFFAQGNGQMTVRLLKDSATSWNSQYYYNLTLDSSAAGKEYVINFSDFVSEGHGYNLNPSDIKAVVFTFNFNNVNTNFNFYAGQIAFSNETVSTNKNLQSKLLTVSPNPNNGNFVCTFESDAARTMQLNVADVSGRIIYRQSIQATTGLNSVPVTLPANIKHPSMLLLTLGYGDVTYSQVKVSID